MPAGFISEQRNYAIELKLDANSVPLDWELSVNDRPLERVFKGGRDQFRFSTEFFAGEVRLTLTGAGRIWFDVQLIVEPDRYKLTRADYAAMIADIRRSTIALYRIGNVTLPAPTAASARRTTLITLELVRMHLTQFEAAVERLTRRPARLLTASERRVDLLKARNIDDRGLSRALRSKSMRGATIAEGLAAPRLVGALKGNWIPQIVETTRTEVADLYEHRAILGFMRWLDTVLFGVLKHADDGAAIAASQVLRRRVEGWRLRLARLMRRELFRGLLPDPALRATTRFRMNPDYASAFSAMSAIRAGLGDGQGLAPAVPIDRTFALYEMWCYIGILHAAAASQPAAAPEVAKLLQGLDDPSRLGVVLASGALSVIDLGSKRSLTYQRHFSPKADAEEVRTHHLDAIPDITVSARNEHGVCRALAIFDPKYRVGPSLLDGLRDLHVYRDAIVGKDGPLIRLAVAISPDAGKLAIDPDALPKDRPVAVTARPGKDRVVFSSLLSSGTNI